MLLTLIIPKIKLDRVKDNFLTIFKSLEKTTIYKNVSFVKITITIISDKVQQAFNSNRIEK